jgi:hypothetical protein
LSCYCWFELVWTCHKGAEPLWWGHESQRPCFGGSCFDPNLGGGWGLGLSDFVVECLINYNLSRSELD